MYEVDERLVMEWFHVHEKKFKFEWKSKDARQPFYEKDLKITKRWKNMIENIAEASDSTVTRLSPAKINLFLHITGS